MEAYGWVIAAAAVVLMIGGIGAGVFAVRRWLVYRDEARLAKARGTFHRRREWLEARFLTLASQSGKPRGLAWADCDFENDVTFARDRNSGQLRALVGVTISFRAVEGGGMEDNPNVGNLRAATAVFSFDGSEWTTDGKPLFNLNPAQAIQHYQHELEMVE
jgi:hypothetical protein